jgi:hypothetical protein
MGDFFRNYAPPEFPKAKTGKFMRVICVIFLMRLAVPMQTMTLVILHYDMGAISARG